MEVLAFVLAWPLLILVFGVVLIALSDIGFLPFLIWPIAIILLIVGLNNAKKSMGAGGDTEKLENLRRWIVVLSISAFLPLLMRYLLLASMESLVILIAGLVAGFALIIWGMFVKNHQVLTRANVIGGGITIVYLYFQLWQLGEIARIIGAASGLVIAVLISVIKLRDRLS